MEQGLAYLSYDSLHKELSFYKDRIKIENFLRKQNSESG